MTINGVLTILMLLGFVLLGIGVFLSGVLVDAGLILIIIGFTVWASNGLTDHYSEGK